MNARLTLIPTPLNETHPLDPLTQETLQNAARSDQSLILIEEHKPARRRWLRWGLPRETIDSFIEYNEHTAKDLNDSLIEKLKSGIHLYLMSDGGLPAFMDPGQNLVRLCHKNKIQVTATPFSHSIALAIALSGASHLSYHFIGFPPQNTNERKSFFKKAFQEKQTVVLMDTPYRLVKTLKEINLIAPNRTLFLGANLNQKEEQCIRGTAESILSSLKNEKAEFILVIE